MTVKNARVVTVVAMLVGDSAVAQLSRPRALLERPTVKPDLTGQRRDGPTENPTSPACGGMGVTKYMIKSLPTEVDEVPFQSWRRRNTNVAEDTESKDDPSAQCLPLNIVQKQTITSPFNLSTFPPRKRSSCYTKGRDIAKSFWMAARFPRIPIPHGPAILSADGRATIFWSSPAALTESHGLTSMATRPRMPCTLPSAIIVSISAT